LEFTLDLFGTRNYLVIEGTLNFIEFGSREETSLVLKIGFDLIIGNCEFILLLFEFRSHFGRLFERD